MALHSGWAPHNDFIGTRTQKNIQATAKPDPIVPISSCGATMTSKVTSKGNNRGRQFWTCGCTKGAFIWANQTYIAGTVIKCSGTPYTPGSPNDYQDTPQQQPNAPSSNYGPPQFPPTQLNFDTYLKWGYIDQYIRGLSEEEGTTVVDLIYTSLSARIDSINARNDQDGDMSGLI